MKITLKNLGSLLFFVFCMPPLSFSQDTLKIFRFPPIDQIDVVVKARVIGQTGKLRFEYDIESLLTSRQTIWAIDIPFDATPHNTSSPNGWFAIVGGRTETIGWGSRDSVFNIQPGQILSGFGYESEGLPSIRLTYLAGWAEPPELTFEPDSVVGEDVLEASKKVLTVGAAKPPTPFIPLAFLDTLTSYKHQAFALGWIKNQGIVQSLDAKLDNAKRQLQRNNTTAARNTLQAFLNEVEALWKGEEHPYGGKQITSEAYALLKFNAEYLVSKL
jgi:hypothetical protein